MYKVEEISFFGRIFYFSVADEQLILYFNKFSFTYSDSLQFCRSTLLKDFFAEKDINLNNAKWIGDHKSGNNPDFFVWWLKR